MFVYSKCDILTKGKYIASSKRLGGFKNCGTFNEFFVPSFIILEHIFDEFNIILVNTDHKSIREIKSSDEQYDFYEDPIIGWIFDYLRISN